MLKAFKKVTVSLATVALLSTIFTHMVSAEEPELTRFTELPRVVDMPFTDVIRSNGQYAEAAIFLYEEGIIQGKSATAFGIYDHLKRGDAAVILAKALLLDVENVPDAGFKDVNSRIEPYVNALVEAGIISGFSKDRFGPDELLTRGAMAKFLVLGFDLNDYAEETSFSDAVGAFKPYIEALYGTNITVGKAPSFFGTYQEISRGDFANLLYKSMKFKEKGSLFYAYTADVVDTSTLSISYKEPIPEKYTAQSIAETTILSVSMNGMNIELNPENAIFSDDRKTVTFNHEDLAGKNGMLTVDKVRYVFDY